jgi:hypothetical protein
MTENNENCCGGKPGCSNGETIKVEVPAPCGGSGDPETCTKDPCCKGSGTVEVEVTPCEEAKKECCGGKPDCSDTSCDTSSS